MRLRRLPQGVAWVARLSGEERRVFFAAALTARRAHIELKTRTVASVVESQRARRSASSIIDSSLSAERIAELSARSMRIVPGRPTCLPRSIAMHHELRIRDLPGEIRIGAKLEDESLRFHAWVVSGDTVLMEDPGEIDGFAPFDLDSTMLGTGFE